MKVQEVILRAMAKRITWWQAAEIIGISDRQMRRWRRRYVCLPAGTSKTIRLTCPSVAPRTLLFSYFPLALG